MDPQLSKSVSTKILRLKERFLQLFKVRGKFDKSRFHYDIELATLNIGITMRSL